MDDLSQRSVRHTRAELIEVVGFYGSRAATEWWKSVGAVPMPLETTSLLVCVALLASEPRTYSGMLTDADFRTLNQRG